MTALSTTEGYVATTSEPTIAGKLLPLRAPSESDLNADSREMLSILGRTFYFLGLGTVAVVAVTGQLPLFFLPLGLFLFFGSALRWRRPHPARAATTQQECEGSVSSNEAQNESRTRYTDTA